MMNILKIKPCPFCGSLPSIRYSFDTLLIECTNKSVNYNRLHGHVDSDSAEKLIKFGIKEKIRRKIK